MVGNPLRRKIPGNGSRSPYGGTKHLLTLQEDVSKNQFREEVTESGVRLVSDGSALCLFQICSVATFVTGELYQKCQDAL